MATLSALVPILSLFFGAFLAKITQSEITKGKQHLLLLLHALFGVIIGIIASTYNIWYSLAGILIFAINFKLKIKYPIYTVPLFAILVVLYPATLIPTLIFFIPLGAIHNKEKTKLFIYAMAYIAIVITSLMLSTKPI